MTSKLDTAVQDINKRHGAGTVVSMGDEPLEVDVVSTGAINLDLALGVGGLPLGRVVTIAGPESSGKSTLALTVVAEAQKMGYKCAYIDSEMSLDTIYAVAIGVKVDDLLISQPDYMEQGLDVVDALASTGEVQVIVVDSVAAMVPLAEVQGEYGDSHVGLAPRLWSQAMRKLTGICKRNNVMLLLINQLREKIGVMFGSPETQPGGRAIKFYASVVLDVRRIETQKEAGEAVGNRTRVKVQKSKVSAPFKQAEFDIVYGHGISTEGCILDLSVERQLVDKSGAWYAYQNEKMGQGRSKAIEWLTINPDVVEVLRKTILEG